MCVHNRNHYQGQSQCRRPGGPRPGCSPLAIVVSVEGPTDAPSGSELSVRLGRFLSAKDPSPDIGIRIDTDRWSKEISPRPGLTPKFAYQEIQRALWSLPPHKEGWLMRACVDARGRLWRILTEYVGSGKNARLIAKAYLDGPGHNGGRI